jgi:hypothetical protein
MKRHILMALGCSLLCNSIMRAEPVAGGSDAVVGTKDTPLSPGSHPAVSSGAQKPLQRSLLSIFLAKNPVVPHFHQEQGESFPSARK